MSDTLKKVQKQFSKGMKKSKDTGLTGQKTKSVMNIGPTHQWRVLGDVEGTQKESF